ncbi:MAG: transcriptional regulator [Desulfurococcales archaeon]|nr:transcriptional regulator [Desulfurococcales archaeon]
MGTLRLLTGAARILLALSRAGGRMTFSELVKATGMAPSLLDRNLKALLAEGLVEKRGRFYVLTSNGRAKIESLIAEIIGR